MMYPHRVIITRRNGSKFVAYRSRLFADALLYARYNITKNEAVFSQVEVISGAAKSKRLCWVSGWTEADDNAVYGNI